MMGEIFCFSENTLYKDSNLYNVFSAYYTPGYVNTLPIIEHPIFITTFWKVEKYAIWLMQTEA